MKCCHLHSRTREKERRSKWIDQLGHAHFLLSLSASFCVICVVCLQFYQGTAFHAHFCLQFTASSDLQSSHAFLDHLDSHQNQVTSHHHLCLLCYCDNDEANRIALACDVSCCCRHNHCSRCNTTFYSKK